MSQPVPPPVPVRVKAPHGAREMQVEWSDGHLGRYPHDVLRGYCPCAECQGHSGTIRYREGGNLELRDVATVGNYAIALTWGDGHSSGIYDFRYLRHLCRCERCAPGT
jgi:DUF971 family protein